MTLADFSSFLRSFWSVWLFLIFAGIMLYVFWPGNKKRLQGYADMPLRDDDDSSRNGEGR